MNAPNKPHPVTGLPFVFDHPAKSRGQRRERSFWHVQPTGNSIEDCLTGDRFACAYLRFIAKTDAPGYLISIVEGMCEARAERERSCIELGFLGTIDFASTFGWRQAQEHSLASEHSWRMYGKGALVNTRPDGSVVIEQPDGTRLVYRRE
jgi:hypothetical protein